MLPCVQCIQSSVMSATFHNLDDLDSNDVVATKHNFCKEMNLDSCEADLLWKQVSFVANKHQLAGIHPALPGG